MLQDISTISNWQLAVVKSTDCQYKSSIKDGVMLSREERISCVIGVVMTSSRFWADDTRTDSATNLWCTATFFSLVPASHLFLALSSLPMNR